VKLGSRGRRVLSSSDVSDDDDNEKEQDRRDARNECHIALPSERQKPNQNQEPRGCLWSWCKDRTTRVVLYRRDFRNVGIVVYERESVTMRRRLRCIAEVSDFV
jgi:hypothetical protein